MMKNWVQIFAIGVLALWLSGCAAMNGDNPWAPPEKKKTLAERWDEEAKKSAEAKSAAPASAPAVSARPDAAPVPAPAEEASAPETREIAELVFADPEKKMAVAYRLGGVRVPVKKGDVFALRGKDLTLRGVARLDVIDGDTLGFELLGGTAAVGDFAAIPGRKLLAEMEEAFPLCVAPEPAER